VGAQWVLSGCSVGAQWVLSGCSIQLFLVSTQHVINLHDLIT